MAILDINEEAWNKTALHNLSADRTRFYTTDVTSSKSISNAVGAVAQWATETGRPLGGVVAAAGIGTAGRVGSCCPLSIPCHLLRVFVVGD